MLLKNNIPIKYVLGKIKWEVLAVSAYTILVAIAYHNFHFTRISIPISVPAIMGTVLSLLLAFRSNQAYDRWWEARTLWGSIVNDSRTLGRMVSTFIENPYYDEEIDTFKHRFIERQIAWCYCLGQSLRKSDPFAGSLNLLSSEEMEYLNNYDNKPSGILRLHSKDLINAMKNGWINQYQQVAMERILEKLCDSMGGCERIKNTIFPVTYSLYTHFSLVLFISMLPFGLIEIFGLMEIPMVIAISASLFLIEKMAIHLQDPFENKPTDTPVTLIAGIIKRDLKQMISKRECSENLNQKEKIVYEKEVFFVL